MFDLIGFWNKDDCSFNAVSTTTSFTIKGQVTGDNQMFIKALRPGVAGVGTPPASLQIALAFQGKLEKGTLDLLIERGQPRVENEESVLAAIPKFLRGIIKRDADVAMTEVESEGMKKRDWCRDRDALSACVMHCSHLGHGWSYENCVDECYDKHCWI